MIPVVVGEVQVIPSKLRIILGIPRTPPRKKDPFQHNDIKEFDPN
jgi:hypothetical protein